ncbi:MAG TPA: response regulator [Flavobacterium sp.]|jgi:CheY-like chemotaxis protein|nr:response regulator [Flavobacterium sp.]
MKTIKRVLLVEDDRDDQEFFIQAAKEVNPALSVTIADNGIAALEMLAEGYTPDIIFLDLNMRFLHGFEFMSKIKEMITLSTIPVVIFSTSNNPMDIEKARETGAVGYLQKPDDFDVLCTKINSVITQKFSFIV